MTKLIFKSSILRSGSITRPDVLEITSELITYKKRNKNLITFSEMNMLVRNICGIEIIEGVISSKIIINSSAIQSKIIMDDISIVDAKIIKSLLLSDHANMSDEDLFLCHDFLNSLNQLAFKEEIAKELKKRFLLL